MNFSESYWPGIALCGIFAMLFLMIWNVTQKRRFMYASYACIAVSPLFVLFDRAQVTEREKIEQAVVSMTNHFRLGEIDRVVSWVSPDHKEVEAAIRGASKLVSVKSDIRLTDMRVELLADNSIGKIDFRANTELAVNGAGDVGRHPTRWLLTWHKEGGEWKLVQIERKNPLTGEIVGVFDAT